MSKSEFPKTISKNGFNFEVRSLDELTTYLTLGWSENSGYVHQEFPMAVHGPEGTSRSVKNEAELKAALAEGFSRNPGGKKK